MLKNILNLDGAQQLSNEEQKGINGGITRQCSNAIAMGCDVTISPADCVAIYESIYNTVCKCCS